MEKLYSYVHDSNISNYDEFMSILYIMKYNQLICKCNANNIACSNFFNFKHICKNKENLFSLIPNLNRLINKEPLLIIEKEDSNDDLLKIANLLLSYCNEFHPWKDEYILLIFIILEFIFNYGKHNLTVLLKVSLIEKVDKLISKSDMKESWFVNTREEILNILIRWRVYLN